MNPDNIIRLICLEGGLWRVGKKVVVGLRKKECVKGIKNNACLAAVCLSVCLCLASAVCLFLLALYLSAARSRALGKGGQMGSKYETLLRDVLMRQGQRYLNWPAVVQWLCVYAYTT